MTCAWDADLQKGRHVGQDQTGKPVVNGQQDLNRGGRPKRKPDTFVFLGFTHFLAKTRSGILNIVRTPSVKARERFIRKVRIWVTVNRHLPSAISERT